MPYLFRNTGELAEFLASPLQGVQQSFPPYNILMSKDEQTCKLQVAIAGFTIDNVDIEVEKGSLTVKGQCPEVNVSEEWVVQKKGIATRSFNLSFRVNPEFIAKDAYMTDGILVILLGRQPSPKEKLLIKAKPQLLVE